MPACKINVLAHVLPPYSGTSLHTLRCLFLTQQPGATPEEGKSCSWNSLCVDVVQICLLKYSRSSCGICTTLVVLMARMGFAPLSLVDGEVEEDYRI